MDIPLRPRNESPRNEGTTTQRDPWLTLTSRETAVKKIAERVVEGFLTVFQLAMLIACVCVVVVSIDHNLLSNIRARMSEMRQYKGNTLSADDGDEEEMRTTVPNKTNSFVDEETEALSRFMFPFGQKNGRRSFVDTTAADTRRRFRKGKWDDSFHTNVGHSPELFESGKYHETGAPIMNLTTIEHLPELSDDDGTMTNGSGIIYQNYPVVEHGRIQPCIDGDSFEGEGLPCEMDGLANKWANSTVGSEEPPSFLEHMVIYIIRHAEKGPSGHHLSEQGWKRAHSLVPAFSGRHRRFEEPRYLAANLPKRGYSSLETLTPLSMKLDILIDTNHSRLSTKENISDWFRALTPPVLIAWEHKDIYRIATVMLGAQAAQAEKDKLLPIIDWPSDSFRPVVELHLNLTDGAMNMVNVTNEEMKDMNTKMRDFQYGFIGVTVSVGVIILLVELCKKRNAPHILGTSDCAAPPHLPFDCRA